MEADGVAVSGGSDETSGAGTTGTTASSRWNPTKEQISVLEGLYKQGIRTPSAEQIQQITSRLKDYGHIEGKNVFYWFQNHKARQRQKQKQESMVYINRFLHSTTPILPPCTNVFCSPFCVPPGGVGLYPQFQKVLLPGGVRRRSGETMQKIQDSGRDGNNSENFQADKGCPNYEFHETLQLFPLHPTGILEGRSENCFASSSHPGAGAAAAGNFNSEKSMGEGGEQPFFNFFADQGSCEGE